MVIEILLKRGMELHLDGQRTIREFSYEDDIENEDSTSFLLKGAVCGGKEVTDIDLNAYEDEIYPEDEDSWPPVIDAVIDGKEITFTVTKVLSDTEVELYNGEHRELDEHTLYIRAEG